MTARADQVVARACPRLATAMGISLAFHAAAVAAILAYQTLASGRPPAAEDEVTVVTLAEEAKPESAARIEPPVPPRTEESKPAMRPAAVVPHHLPTEQPKTRAEIPASSFAPEQAAPPPSVVGDSTGSAGPRILDRPAGYRLGSADTPAPSYPLSARRKGHQGTVLVSLDVGVDGSARGVRVATSSGDDALDRAASETLARWRLVPAMKAGEPVSSRIEVPIAFVLE